MSELKRRSAGEICSNVTLGNIDPDSEWVKYEDVEPHLIGARWARALAKAEYAFMTRFRESMLKMLNELGAAEPQVGDLGDKK